MLEYNSIQDIILRRDPLQLLRDPHPHLHQLVEVAPPAQKMLAKWIAPLVRLVSQLHLAHLAHVAVNVEIFLHGNNPDCLLSTLYRGDTLATRSTFGSKNSVEVIDAVDLVVKVNCKGNTVQAVVADTAAEAARMISLPDGLKDTLHDEVPTDLALLRGLLEARVQVVLLAVHLAVDIVESLPTESSATRTADKTGGVVEVTHSLTSLTCPRDSLRTGATRPEKFRLLLFLHLFLQLFCQSLYLHLCLTWPRRSGWGYAEG